MFIAAGSWTLVVMFGICGPFANIDAQAGYAEPDPIGCEIRTTLVVEHHRTIAACERAAALLTAGPKGVVDVACLNVGHPEPARNADGSAQQWHVTVEKP